jgi:hypothetical protein
MPICFFISICPHVSAQLPPDRFLWNLILGTSMKVCWENPRLVKSGQKIGHFTRWPKYVLLLLATLDCHKSAPFQWTGIRLSGWHRRYNTARICHSVMLYIHCVSCCGLSRWCDSSLPHWLKNYLPFRDKLTHFWWGQNSESSHQMMYV